jgi:hypothetical protein
MCARQPVPLSLVPRACGHDPQIRGMGAAVEEEVGVSRRAAIWRRFWGPSMVNEGKR